MLLHLGVGSHCECWMKLFKGLKRSYDQWPVTSCHFKRWVSKFINKFLIQVKKTTRVVWSWMKCSLSWQCCIRSYLEASIPVCDTKLRPPNPQKYWFLVFAFVTIHCCKATRAMFWAIQNSKWPKFPMALSLNPTGESLQHPAPLLTPRLPRCTTAFLLAMLIEKLTPPKRLLDTALAEYIKCWV